MNSVPKKKSFFNFFPPPEYLLLSPSGIAITDENIRYVRFSRSSLGNRLKLSRAEKMPTPTGIVRGGVVEDPAKLSAALRLLSQRFNIRYTSATLPDERAYLFSTYIDKVPAEGVRDAVAFILEENAPVSLAESVFDFEVTEESADSSQIKVTVAVLPKKVVESYIEIFENAGITPISFDIESQAIARAVIAPEDNRTHLILNLTSQKTGFYVVEDNVVQFTTTLPYGYSVALNEYGSHIDDLKTEIKKIFSFWDTRLDKYSLPQKKIERILVTGSGSVREEFVKELLREVTVDVSFGDAWVNTHLALNKLPEPVAQESLSYAAAVGLALP